MRPGTRIRFWSPKFRNKQSVEPPGLLLLLASLCLLSVIGVLVYAVVLTPDGVWSTTADSESAAYIALLHFALPFCVFYTVSTNSWLSRVLIATYFIVLCVATALGKGFLGGLSIGPTAKVAAAIGFLVVVIVWLFGSPSMRIYYLLLSDKPIPPELESRAYELAAKGSVSPRMKAAIDKVADKLETAVMIGLIVVVIYAYVTQ